MMKGPHPMNRAWKVFAVVFVLLLTSGCGQVRATASSCKQAATNLFSGSGQVSRRERRALVAIDKATNGGIIPAPTGQWPCKTVPPPCNWNGVTCSSGHITSFSLAHRQLAEVPQELFQLSDLHYLDLSYNQLTELPPELGQLSNLRVLGLIYNQLAELPPELGQLPNLQELYLYSNQLTALPPELGQLSNLQWLDLGNNQLVELPPELEHLSNLQWLHLVDNQLAELPSELGQLSNLQWLGLSGNPLTSLPPEICQLPDGVVIHPERDQLCGD
jgi:Leucine-rich repeat (LRR) protein